MSDPEKDTNDASLPRENFDRREENASKEFVGHKNIQNPSESVNGGTERKNSRATSTKSANMKRNTYGNIDSSPEEIEKRYHMSAVGESKTPDMGSTLLEDPTPELTTYGGIKLGWVQGVLIPCLLNIWGVMLFLRIAWIVAQAGIALTIVIIFMSGVVCVITTLSLSAICTNGQLRGGGVYYLVSRSLGAELGASVGIIFAFANAVAASMNTIGFCESFNELLKSFNVKIIDNSVNDIRIVGALALLLMCMICAVGMDWETRTQNFLIVIIVTAILNYIVGSVLGPMNDRERAQGFQGLSFKIAAANFAPDYRVSEGEEHDFFSVFAMYFPAVTGVQAGANICGDLRDPATAIPKGTLLALAISTTSYVTMALLSGIGALRDSSGNMTVAHDPEALSACKPDCEYGLHHNYKIMHLMALWGPLIYGGCWAATLSTALTNLLSVPRLIQALGIDHIYPGLIFFSKPYGRHGEPYRGYVLVFCVSLLFLLIADLNRIAPLITNFYLASYALINFCTFHAAFFKPLSWRPEFQYFNLWLSLAGCILCVTMMMIISWLMALITTFIFLFLYLLVLYRKPVTPWEGSTDAQRYQDTIVQIIQISQRNAKYASAYNPQLLVMTGEPYAREWLLDMGKLITSVGSFMVVADVLQKNLTPSERRLRIEAGEEWLRERKARAFYVLIQNLDFEQSLLALLQSAGLGRLSPNIILIGYKYNWRFKYHEDLGVYYRWIQLAFQFDLAVAILRVSRMFRPPKGRKHEEIPVTTSVRALHLDKPSRVPIRVMAEDSETEDVTSIVGPADKNESVVSSRELAPISATSPSVTALSKSFNLKPLVFPANSTLDAWWLYEDGGMTILLPYIIARRSSKDKMNLKIFVLPRSKLPTEELYINMKHILAKFRIEYSKLILVDGVDLPPAQSTCKLFKSLTANIPGMEESENKLMKKTSRYLRLRELMIEHSFGADLIVMTLPFPREKSLTAALYMAWLEIMSRDLPPIMFVRGNKTSVIEP